jgi:hypothetical protein
VTVLNWMDRDRYLELLEREKLILRGSEWAATARIGVQLLPAFGGQMQGGELMHWGAELSYGQFVAGFYRAEGPFLETAGTAVGTPQPQSWGQGHLKGWLVEGGYDWTPQLTWHRFQPYVPLRAQWVTLAIDLEDPSPGLSGGGPGVAVSGGKAGVGLRWWGSDLFSFDTRASYGFGFGDGQLRDADGSPFYLNKREVGTIRLDGLEFCLGIRIGWL